MGRVGTAFAVLNGMTEDEERRQDLRAAKRHDAQFATRLRTDPQARAAVKGMRGAFDRIPAHWKPKKRMVDICPPDTLKRIQLLERSVTDYGPEHFKAFMDLVYVDGARITNATKGDKGRKKAGATRGAQRTAERKAKGPNHYKDYFLAWVQDGARMSDFQQNRNGETPRDIERVMRGADLCDFAGEHLAAVRHVRSLPPPKGRKRNCGWDDPRKRRPDPSKPSSKRHNDWLRELRDDYEHAANKPTD